MISRSLIPVRTRPRAKCCGGQGLAIERLAAASNRRDEQNAVAFFEGAGFAAKEADVFFIEVHVKELADLALILAYVAGRSREGGRSLVKGLAHRARATGHFWGPLGGAAEGRRNFAGVGAF